MKQLLIFILFAFCQIYTVQAQSEDNDSLQDAIFLFTQDDVLSANLPTIEDFTDWFNPIMEKLETAMRESQDDRHFSFTFIFHTDGTYEYIVSACPALSDEADKKFKKIGDNHPNSPKPLYVPVSISYQGMFKSGCPEGQKLSPTYETPEMKWDAKFEAADLAEKVTMLQEWAKNMIPVAGYIQSNVETQYLGVRAVGKVSNEFTKDSDINQLTYKNNDYWRGVVEMAPKDFLIPTSRILMEASNGKFDLVRNYSKILGISAGEEPTFSDFVLEELNRYIDSIDELVGKGINAGIHHHDKGEYDKALEEYEKVLEMYPNCAWAHYEVFLSKYNAGLEAGEDKSNELWSVYSKDVYNSNPLYNMQAVLSSPLDAYHFSRRQDLSKLFSNFNLGSDVPEFAAIALDLGEYGLAAELYWLSIAVSARNEQDVTNYIIHFLYALDKLGNKELGKIFDFNLPKEFKKIDKRRDKAMKSNSLYKSMK